MAQISLELWGEPKIRYHIRDRNCLYGRVYQTQYEIDDCRYASHEDPLEKLGQDIALAPKKRSLTVVMMAERWLGVAESTSPDVRKGDPNVEILVEQRVILKLNMIKDRLAA